jgi:hypothetical protein
MADNKDSLLDGIVAEAQEVRANLAAKYYDLNKLKKTILDDLSQYRLSDLQFEKGRYELAVDFVGSIETAARSFGLAEVGIEETENGYRIGDQEASSIEELEFAEEVVMEFAAKLAADIQERLDLAGALYFGFNTEWGDGALRLFYAFEDADIPELQKLGVTFQDFKSPEMSFSQIISSLEKEGCHETARKLYDILRGQ